MSDKKLIISFVTVDNIETAKNIAQSLIEKRLAACVNILPNIISIYRWKGNIENDQELLLKIKSTSEKYPDLEKEVKKLHPYETVEVIAVEATNSNPDYLNWVIEETS